MRFTIKRDELLKALNIASRGVASKTPVPVLNNFKLLLNEEGLFITGSNFDLTIRTQIPLRRGENEIIRNYKEGSTLINARILTEIARKMETEELTVDVIDSTVATIADKKSEYKLNCVRPEEYPDIDLEANGTQLTMSTADFGLMVDQTAFAASTKELQPVHTAVNLRAGDGVLIATALDTARLARKTMPIRQDADFVANIPAKMLVEIAHLVGDHSTVDLSISDKKAIFEFGYTLVATRLIEGNYPKTDHIINRTGNHLLEVNAQDLIKAIDRANILSIERQNVVDLTMGPDGVQVTSMSSQVGSVVETIEIYRFEGEEISVSFNSEYVVAAVKALGSQDVVFSFVEEMRPFSIRNAADDSVVQVVTPVKPR